MKLKKTNTVHCINVQKTMNRYFMYVKLENKNCGFRVGNSIQFTNIYSFYYTSINAARKYLVGKKCPTFYSRPTKTCFHNSEDSANLFLKFCFDVVVKTTGRATKTEIEIGMFKYTRIVCQCYSRLS